MTEAAGFGQRLRNARDRRGLSPAQAERLTRIRAAYLSALEEERFDLLPPPPYGKGFVRAYAMLLGLDPVALVEEFEARQPPSAVVPLSEAADIPLEPPPPPTALRRFATRALWVAVPVVLLLAVGLVRNVQRFARSQPGASPVPAATAPAVISPARPVLPGVSGPAASGSTPAVPASPAAVSPAPPPAAGEAPITLALVVTDTTWLRVRADGERIFEGLMRAGDSGTWTAEHELLIRIGNAAAVQVTVNGRPLGSLGRPAQVVTLRFPRSLKEP